MRGSVRERTVCIQRLLRRVLDQRKLTRPHEYPAVWPSGLVIATQQICNKIAGLDSYTPGELAHDKSHLAR